MELPVTSPGLREKPAAKPCYRMNRDLGIISRIAFISGIGYRHPRWLQVMCELVTQLARPAVPAYDTWRQGACIRHMEQCLHTTHGVKVLRAEVQGYVWSSVSLV
jgi:hypothetical protein